jgi:hypothetical protein
MKAFIATGGATLHAPPSHRFPPKIIIIIIIIIINSYPKFV